MNDALIPAPGAPVAPELGDTTVLEPDPIIALLEQRLVDAEAKAEAAENTAKAAAAAADSKVTRFAVYDTVYGRFLGGVLDKRPTKTELARLIKDDASATDDTADLEIREV